MSKKKKDDEFYDILNILNSGSKNKENKFRLASSDEIQDIPRIPTGIKELDDIIGGGWPLGRIGEIYGLEGSGKTALLLKTYAANQVLGKKCVHFDVEQSLDINFAQLHGVDTSQLMFYQPDEEDYAENLLEKIASVCASGKVDVVGVDSIAAFIPKEELEKRIEDQQMGLLARVMSKALRKIVVAARQGNCTVLFINQVRTKIGQLYGNPEDTPGGKALKFYASFRVEVKRKLLPKSECPEIFEGDNRIGHILKLDIIKNKTAMPFKSTEVVFLFKPRRQAIQAIADAIDQNILVKKNNNHKILIYTKNEEEFRIELPEKGDWESCVEIMRDSGLIMSLLFQLGYTNFDQMIEDGDLTEDIVDGYIKSLKTDDEKKSSKIKNEKNKEEENNGNNL